ncbi:hypothetical protein MJO29_010200 [Puccinia striiformis f. sp. tritici]|nr:hypothetical protein MJO29_010200 [Puccinia striiformis f. sp. tritici]
MSTASPSNQNLNPPLYLPYQPSDQYAQQSSNRTFQDSASYPSESNPGGRQAPHNASYQLANQTHHQAGIPPQHNPGFYTMDEITGELFFHPDPSLARPVRDETQLEHRSTHQTAGLLPSTSLSASRAPQNTAPPADQTTSNAPEVGKKTTGNKGDERPQPNLREINRLLKNLAKDRSNPAPQQSTLNQDHDDENAENTGDNCGGENNDGLDRSGDDNGGDDHSGGGANNLENDHVGENNFNDDNGEGKQFVPVPDDVMHEIVGMDLDELREYKALHAENRRLPAYLKAELEDMYYEFERQLHIFAI